MRAVAIVVRFIRAESISRGRSSKNSNWLAKAIHSKALAVCEAYLVHICKAL